MSPRATTLLSLALLAILLYVIGFRTGTFAVIIIAVMVEMWFWFQLFFADRSDQSKPEP